MIRKAAKIDGVDFVLVREGWSILFIGTVRSRWSSRGTVSLMRSPPGQSWRTSGSS